MSIPVFIRNPDGTAWEGRIAYKWSSVRKSKLELGFNETAAPTIDDAYQLFGVCSTLHISSSQHSLIGQLDKVYRFLYGHTLKELMEVQEEGSYSAPGTYFYEPQEWTTQTVRNMDWGEFCFAYYTFLCSDNNFESKAWGVLGFILNTLRNSPYFLKEILSKHGKDADEVACFDFWETVCTSLQTKSLAWLSEATCYTAFHAMISVRPLFSVEKYKQFERKCFEVFDEIARRRIDEACQKAYTVYELSSFNIELLFFYKDYFAQSASSKETERYVMNAAFTLLHTKGDKVAAGENALAADTIYEAALKYAQTEDDKKLIASKRNKISAAVAVAREAQQKAQQEYEKKWEKKKRKDKAKGLAAKVLVIIFLISVVTTVLFGALTLFAALMPFSKIAFVVSLCIMVPFLIILGVAAIQDKRK